MSRPVPAGNRRRSIGPGGLSSPGEDGKSIEREEGSMLVIIAVAVVAVGVVSYMKKKK